MSNSPLVNCTIYSPNHSGKRTHSIDRITPHCVVGQCHAEVIGNLFKAESRKASSNYGIGTDGRVGLYVDEYKRSWCSSSRENDQRAVTIECASDTKFPYAFNDKVYNKLIDLCTDICKRNNKTKLLYLGTKDKSLAYNPKADEMIITVHRWFFATACPGDWLMNKLSDLAKVVTDRLTPKNNNEVKSGTLYKVQVGAYKVKQNAINQKAKLEKEGFTAFVTQVGELYKVQLGAFSDKKNAEKFMATIKAKGYSAFIQTVKS